MAEQNVIAFEAKKRLREMLAGLGQGGELVPMQKLAVAAWNFIVTVATTRRGVKAKAPESATEEESAEQEAAASGGAGGPDLTPTPLGPTPLPSFSNAAQGQAARAAVAERQGQAEGNQGEESLEREFERVAAPFRQAQEAQGQSLPPMENDADAVIAGAIQEELGGGLPPAASNDNYSSTARNIAGSLPPGLGNGDNDNRGSGADGASQQPGDDLVKRLEDIAAVAAEYGADSPIATNQMQELLTDCQKAGKTQEVWSRVEEMQKSDLEALLHNTCMINLKKSFGNSNG